MKTITDINHRWENGIDHHPKSYALFKLLEEVDFVLGGDSFCFKSGGDGDNGEQLMYLLDIIFDSQDNGEEDLLQDELKRLKDEMYKKAKAQYGF